jgi:predicted RNA methylase
MARILDLGCGTGNYPIRAQLSAGDEVVGVDIDEQRLARPGNAFLSVLISVRVANRCPIATRLSTA